MINAIYGKKIGSTQIFDEKGNAMYVTAIETKPCVIVQIKKADKDGYNALKVGFGQVKQKNIKKPIKGIYNKVKVEPKKYLREIRVDKFDKEYNVGENIDIKIFEIGDKVKVTGYSKGKGFSGVIKRHNFHRGRMSHGSHSHRLPGAVGMCATPAKIIKGKKMPGRMGNNKITMPGTEILDVVEDQDIIFVKGSVPGSAGNMVFIKKISK